MFIAIVVDTFIAQKQNHDLPITQSDVDQFVAIWKTYDPNATGYIPFLSLDQLLVDLHESDTAFFADDPEQIMNPEMRNRLIVFLEIPMHKQLSCFMFYDVLTIACRYTVETNHKLIAKRREELSNEIKDKYKRLLDPVGQKHRLNLEMRKDP